MIKSLAPRTLLSRAVACVMACVCVLTPWVQAFSITSALALAIGPLSVLSFAAFPSSTYAQAVDFTPAKTKGTATAKSVAAGITPPTLNTTTGTVTINSSNPIANGQVFTGEQMIPGSTDPGRKAASDGNVSLFGDKSGMGAKSGTSSSALLGAPGADAYGDAYKTVRSRAVQTSHPDLRNDPTIAASQSVYKGTDTNGFVASMTATCQTTTTPTQAPVITRVADHRTCERTPAASGCRVTRPFTSYAFQSTQVNIFYNGWVEDYLEVEAQVRTPEPRSFECVDCTNWEMESAAAAAGIYFHVVSEKPRDWRGTIRVQTIGEYDWPAPGPRTMSNNFLDVTQKEPTFDGAGGTQIPEAGNGYVARVFASHVKTPGLGLVELYATVTIGQATPGELVDEPLGCTSAKANCDFLPGAWTSAGTLGDLASTDKWKCVNADDRRVIGTVTVTASNWGVLEPLYPGEPTGTAPICYDAEARNYVCSYPAAPGPVDTCGPLEADTQCRFLRSECLPEHVDEATGRCFLHTQHWDCGTDVATAVTTTTTTSCAGPIRCMGTECIDPQPPESNPNFDKAAMQLSTVQWMDSDKECKAGGECLLFKGKGYSCRDVFFGVQNCCDSPTNTTMADYIKLTYYTYKLTNWTAVATYMQSAGMGGLTSGFQALQGAFSTTSADLSKAVVNAWQSLASDFMPDLASATKDFTVDKIKETAKEYLIEWGKEVFGEAFATYGGEAAVGSMIDGMGMVIDFLSAFMMYYAIAMILIKIIWKCESSEFELATKRELKSCHFLGKYCSARVLGVCYEKSASYCCFNSPLGRIIQEQVRDQISLAWPSPGYAPECPGISIEQMKAVNWNAVDLSEWMGYLQLAGLHPTGGDGSTMYALERSTKYVNAPGTQGMTVVETTTQAVGSPNTPMTKVVDTGKKMWGGLP